MACPVAEESFIKRTKNSEYSVLQNSLTQSKDYRTVALSAEPSPQTFARKSCYFQKGNSCEQIIYFCCLSMGSYLGVLCRIYLSKLSRWDGVPLFTSLYSLVMGLVIMGFTTGHKLVLAESHPFTYQAITTGLCGSLTSFSSWNSEAISSLLQTDHVPPNNAARIFGWGTTILLGLGMSAGALGVGKHLAAISPWSDWRMQNRERTASSAIDSSELDGLCKFCHTGLKCHTFLCVCLWLLVSVLMVAVPSIVLHEWDLAFSLVFAALGTYVRWHLAPLNSTSHNFKLGTFLVNVMGTWLLGGVLSVSEIYPDGCVHDLLVGIGTGFCGCLTTVSTFTVELSGLPLRYVYAYAMSSISAAQVGLLLIRIPIQWTTQS